MTTMAERIALLALFLFFCLGLFLTVNWYVEDQVREALAQQRIDLSRGGD